MSDLDDVPPPMDPRLLALLRGTQSSFDTEAAQHADHAFERLTRAQ